ncbi:MAG TPA: ATP-binding protein [Bauldia sp.]|nr:ATP-binding protein [Bauldia sp.]
MNAVAPDLSAAPPVPAGKHPDLGRIISITGNGAVARLFKSANVVDDDDRMTIGRLVGVHIEGSLVVGVVVSMKVAPPTGDNTDDDSSLVAEIDFMGEIRNYESPKPSFQRGVSNYPTIGNRVSRLATGDVAIIHDVGDGETIDVGRLRLDPTVPAFINFEELLRKHFAVVGTTGVGKSTSVALILQEILAKKANLRIFLIDPHNEYGQCFGDMAHVVSPKNLILPFWLFNFEEIVDVFFRGRPGVEEEMEILQELIPLAKAQFAAGSRGDRVILRRQGAGFTADTPVPYRISDLVKLIDERMGKLENRSTWTKYHRLISRIETLGHDSRYTFMFNNLFIEDLMVQVLGDLFRLPINGQPITVLQLAGFPAEVLDAVVSVMCRMAFEFGVWSDGAAPILVACEEAHRYAPADKKQSFGPTVKALSRIAKEGRKYGVFLGCITQRPADLDATILSQCSTVFSMRLANDRDQAIIRSAVPDAGASLVAFLPSLGNREAIAFGEGVPLPTRFRFKDVPPERQPRSHAGMQVRLDAAGNVDIDFINAVVDRWREATTTNQRPRSSLMGMDADGMPDFDDGLGAPLIARKQK